MGDSEDSRILSKIDRPNLVFGVVCFEPNVVRDPRLVPGLHQLGSEQEMDPMPRLWSDWVEARNRLLALGRQRLEAEKVLFSIAGPPPISVAAWKAAEMGSGYSQTKEREDEAADIEEALVSALWATPAASIAGVTVKLLTVLEKGAPSKKSEEFPWPQIRSVIDDLARICHVPEAER